ncbi:MAG: protease modulator HflC [Betaproteobacteria bacterium]|nr:protease modulator HflC [Betaproteobacteria bacterium]
MAGVDGSGKQSTTRRRMRIAVALGIAGIVAAMAKLCCFTVETGEYALVTEFGKPVQVITAPGLGFKYPYQSVRTFDSRLFAYTPASTEFLTLEKTPVVAASTVLWRVSDPKKFFQTVFDRAGAESRLGDILFAELGAAIGRSPLVAFVSIEPKTFRAEAILAEVSGKCREIALRDYGIEVIDVLLKSFDFPKQNRPPLYSRMKSERGRLSMKFRSEGEEEGLKIRAAADQEKSRILSEALKLAQQHRGEGEGRAARIYAESLSKGPEFYEFVRTMQASRNLIPKGTTLMLPADSELFGLLQDSSHYDRGGANRKAGAKPRKEGTMK